MPPDHVTALVPGSISSKASKRLVVAGFAVRRMKPIVELLQSDGGFSSGRWFAGIFAASSARASASFFFKRGRLFGRGRFRVFRMRRLDRPADRFQGFQNAFELANEVKVHRCSAFMAPRTPLRRDQRQAEFLGHPVRNLAARPQPAIGRRLAKVQAQFIEQVRQDRR
jgi:hypothetical protein